jgi:hypothetical protein
MREIRYNIWLSVEAEVFDPLVPDSEEYYDLTEANILEPYKALNQVGLLEAIAYLKSHNSTPDGLESCLSNTPEGRKRLVDLMNDILEFVNSKEEEG